MDIPVRYFRRADILPIFVARLYVRLELNRPSALIPKKEQAAVRQKLKPKPFIRSPRLFSPVVNKDQCIIKLIKVLYLISAGGSERVRGE